MDVRLPIYLDHHATTPCDPRVVEAMLPYFTEIFGNAASRSHGFGFRAKVAVEKAREQVAALIGASPKEIVWTSGATEANNLAILGVADARRDERRHLVTVATEHKAVLDPCAHLASRGWAVTVLPVDSDGLVRLAEVEAALRPDTALVSVMLANNEIGTLQPVAEIAALCRPCGIVVHTDATQAAGQIPIDVAGLGVDLLSLSAHKMYGPKGVGALWVRRGRPRVPIAPITFGGGHERGLRSGTLAVQNLVGMGVAAELAREALDGDVVRVRALRDRLWAGLQTTGGVHLAGSWAHRLPNNLNVGFEGVEAEALMMATRDVAVSSGSACTSATLEPSHVLRALGLPEALAHGSIRFGLGRSTTEAEIDHVIAQYTRKVPELRAMNPLTSAPDVRTLDWIESPRE